MKVDFSDLDFSKVRSLVDASSPRRASCRYKADIW